VTAPLVVVKTAQAFEVMERLWLWLEQHPDAELSLSRTVVDGKVSAAVRVSVDYGADTPGTWLAVVATETSLCPLLKALLQAIAAHERSVEARKARP